MRIKDFHGALIAALVFTSTTAHAQVPLAGLPGTNGNVSATRVSGDRLYIAGSFTRVGESAGGWLSFDAATGQALPGRPHVAGVVYAACSDGLGGWFLGGDFAGADGRPRSNVMHVLADGSLADWAPVVDGSVHDLVLSGGRVFMAGRFTHVSGIARAYVAAVDAATGAVLDWSADADYWVYSLAVSGDDLFMGGVFTTVRNQPRVLLAKVSQLDGSVRAWDAHLTGGFGPSRLLVERSRLLVAGNVRDSSGASFGFLALDPSTALPMPASGLSSSIVGMVWDMVPHGGRIYLASRYIYLPQILQEQALALDRESYQPLDWRPEPHDFATGGGLPSQGECYSIGAVADHVYLGIHLRNGDFGLFPVDTLSGQVQPSLLGLDGLATDVARMRSQGGRLWVGANFRVPVGVPRAGLAEIDLRTRVVTEWQPQLLGFPHSLVAIGSRLYVGYSPRSYGTLEPSAESFDLPTHTRVPWSPDPQWHMDHLHEQSGRLFASGPSRNSGVTYRPWFRELDPVSGAATSWDPQINGPVYKIVSDARALYVTGYFDSVGGQPRRGWAGFSLPELTLMPEPITPLESVSSVGLSEDRIILAGSGLYWPYGDIRVIDRTTGNLQPWHPMQGLLNSGQSADWIASVNGSFLFADYYTPGYVVKRCLFQQAPDSPTPVEFPFQMDDVPTSVELHDGMLVLGGFFTMAGASPAAGLAVFTWPSTAVDPGGHRLTRRFVASPDPARSMVTFSGIDAAVDRIEVVDVAGRRLWSQRRDATTAPRASWDLRLASGEHTSAGIHFARFLLGERCVGTSRFVVLR